MRKLKLATNRAGIAGEWVVKKRILFFWHKVISYSIYANGDTGAYMLAKKALERLEKDG